MARQYIIDGLFPIYINDNTDDEYIILGVFINETSAVSALFLRPIADISDGGWTTDTGGTSLYAAIDEETRSDTDYVRSSENPVDDAMEFDIGPLGSLTSGVLRFAIGKESDNATPIDIKVELRQGSTTIATWNYLNVAFGFAAKAETLTTEQRAAIVPNVSLNVRVTANSAAAAALDIDFTSGSLDSRITFTRAASGTYYNSSGVLSSASTDVARFDYDPDTLTARGLLLEEQRINYALRSEEFDNATWTKQGVGVTANALVAPDGTTTAETLTVNSGTGIDKRAYQTLSAPSGQVMSFSCFVKKGTADFVYIIHEMNGSGDFGFFNLTTGAWTTLPAAVGTSLVETLPNGWYRIGFSRAATTGASNNNMFVGLADANGSTTVTDGKTLHVWGAQAEVGNFASSYIPTTSAAVTRAPDNVSMIGTNFSDWYNTSEGTFVLDNHITASSTIKMLSLSDGSSNNEMFLAFDNNSTNQYCVVTTGGVGQATFTPGTYTPGVPFKVAYAYKLNDFAACLNGGTVATDNTATPPLVDRLFVSKNATDDAARAPQVWIARLSYYDTRKSNLQTLTT